MTVAPDIYRDGCTMAPDRLGRVSHRHVCDRHDLDYWAHRTVLSKFVADARWAAGIIACHWRNTPWQPVALALAVFGWLALTTWGWWPWMRRHRFDDVD